MADSPQRAEFDAVIVALRHESSVQPVIDAEDFESGVPPFAVHSGAD